MTITFLSNTTASVLGAVASGGAQTQLNVTANAPFELNDLVFVDWKTGAIINQKNTPSVSALTAGPAVQNIDFIDVQVTSNSSSISQVGPDGSLYILATAYSGNGPYRRTVMLYKYNQKGVLVAKGLVYFMSSQSSNALSNTCNFVVLSNGNVCVIWSEVLSTPYMYAILSPSLRTIYTGGISLAASLSSPGAIQHMQPTSQGGCILVTVNGIEHISATGVATRPVPQVGLVMASQDHLIDASADQDAYLRPIPLKSGAVGGFGYLYSSSSSGVSGSFYAQINADGTLRGNILTVSAQTASLRFAVSVVSGYIMWSGVAANNFGIIKDDSTVVVGAVSSSNNNSGSAIGSKLAADSSGNFVFLTMNVTDYKWYMRYISPVGVDLATAPIGNLNSNSIPSANWRHVIAKLSTGTVFIWPQGNLVYAAAYTFISNAGVITTGVICNFGGSGVGVQQATVTVINDAAYGLVCNGSSGGPTDAVAFSISNTGIISVSNDVVGSANGRQQIDANYYIRSYADYLNKSFSVVVTNTSAGATAVITYDIASLSIIQYFAVTSVTYAALSGSVVRPFGQGLLVTGGPFTAEANGTPVIAVFIKSRPTVLLGVAASAANDGDLMPVNTKGVFPCSASWKNAVQSFDHSANVPPGNSGSINSGYINLKGL